MAHPGLSNPVETLSMKRRVSPEEQTMMNRTDMDHRDLLRNGTLSADGDCIRADAALLHPGRRFSPFGMRISVRPGPRSRIVHRVLRRRPAGFPRLRAHATSATG